ncbi:jg2760 [Pararge aegeria aegeria]|uniref:Jg2760 protein n=1 Tax=Pararge aegeria aegeria TaxID=348720 RepID=A0A8S4QT67_9NEOP|nr:jg2760 [Pararge aegeria aegeria]
MDYCRRPAKENRTLRNVDRMYGISWTAKVSNAEVLTRVQKRTELVRTIEHRKISYRHDMYRLLQTIMTGKKRGQKAKLLNPKSTVLGRLFPWAPS